MSSSIAIMILGNATSNSSSQIALNYAKAVMECGHRIERLFFYHEAASLGSTFTVNAQDELHLNRAWQEFIAEHQLDAVVCIASGLKRGILDSNEAKRYEKPGHNLSSHMELSGLGQWIDAVCKADRSIVFGN